jgi:hypothetical protein
MFVSLLAAGSNEARVAFARRSQTVSSCFNTVRFRSCDHLVNLLHLQHWRTGQGNIRPYIETPVGSKIPDFVPFGQDLCYSSVENLLHLKFISGAGIATGYGAGRPRGRSSSPGGNKNF